MIDLSAQVTNGAANVGNGTPTIMADIVLRWVNKNEVNCICVAFFVLPGNRVWTEKFRRLAADWPKSVPKHPRELENYIPMPKQNSSIIQVCMSVHTQRLGGSYVVCSKS